MAKKYSDWEWKQMQRDEKSERKKRKERRQLKQNGFRQVTEAHDEEIHYGAA